MNFGHWLGRGSAALLLTALAASPAWAQEAAAAAAAAPPAPDKGDTTWMLISSALVLMMSVPGLALFYGGLVRAKNMLSVLMQVLTIVAIVAILAILVLYWRTFRDVLVGMWKREATAFAFVRNLLVAFIPAVVLGLAIGDYIELLLGNAVVVAWALIIGGIWMLLVEAYTARLPDRDQVTWTVAIGVGLAQVVAGVFPGTSRSASAIFLAMLILSVIYIKVLKPGALRSRQAA